MRSTTIRATNAQTPRGPRLAPKITAFLDFAEEAFAGFDPEALSLIQEPIFADPLPRTRGKAPRRRLAPGVH